ncbi:TapY2 family type IVa secretion system protein [Shewanella violacea]|uniref:Uncharacterized protein n=1 Tax=Shewanella violacea (strain JCM 10179 / CIP 106290 / LMG 19151 / DSS12) TaxID=637905 RepID=D4ZH33_SHEVD|nr:TapY2 family type IVa secretion system protein [Shewanella violacea]BAJ00982.1 conserved hypothetical protein [Shewanella violacea DSS12]
MNYKNQYVFLAVMSMAISGIAIGDNTKNSIKKDYKCYLDTTSGHQIAFYEWQEKRVKLNMAKLPSKKTPSKGDGKRAYIKEVDECVELDAMFTLGGAQQLDQETLR